MFGKAVVFFGLSLGFADLARCEPPFNNPPGVDVWCGKAYRETVPTQPHTMTPALLIHLQNSSFDPGGWLEPPSLNNGSNPLRLQLNVYPRFNYYLDTQIEASFLVDTRVSDRGELGAPYKNTTIVDYQWEPVEEPFTEMLLSVGYWNPDINITLVSRVTVPMNASGIEIPFDLEVAKKALSEFEGGGNTVRLQAVGSSFSGDQKFYTLVETQILPEREDGGSMAVIDRLNGGIWITSKGTGSPAFEPIYPVGFYTRWDWISWLVDPENNAEPDNLASNETKSLQAYKARGYNLIHPVPPGGPESFDSGVLEKFLMLCDELELYVMYDMRHTYLNTSSIQAQLPRLQSHPSLLLYYTGDEPDGSTDPLNGTLDAYNAIRAIDPYHPISLVLNCYNFYFKEYTSGADIILEDTYPIIKSSTFSTVYNTPCNQTYGDCGCDFCHVGDPFYPDFKDKPFKDVIDRVDNFYRYQRWIGQEAVKPVWGVPQWFYDADSFWERYATGQEAIVMSLLRIIHGEMGIVGWIFPTSPEVESATTELATALSREDIQRLLAAGTGQRLSPISATSDAFETEAAAWTLDDNGYTEILAIFVWPKSTLGLPACFELPTKGKDIEHLELVLGSWGYWDETKNGNVVCNNELFLPLDYGVVRAWSGGNGSRGGEHY